MMIPITWPVDKTKEYSLDIYTRLSKTYGISTVCRTEKNIEIIFIGTEPAAEEILPQVKALTESPS